MKHQELLPKLIGITFATLFIAACGASEAGPASVSPTTAPPLPTALLTATLTPAPRTATPIPDLAPATPIPVTGIGVPIVKGDWQVTIEDFRHETEVSRAGLTRMSGGGLGISVSTYSPAEGYTFLVVEGTFRNLDPLTQEEIAMKDISLVDENGRRYDADDMSDPPREFVFLVEEVAVNQFFELQIQEIPVMSLSLGQK